jgi:hypothetical protein
MFVLFLFIYIYIYMSYTKIDQHKLNILCDKFLNKPYELKHKNVEIKKVLEEIINHNKHKIFTSVIDIMKEIIILKVITDKNNVYEYLSIIFINNTHTVIIVYNNSKNDIFSQYKTFTSTQNIYYYYKTLCIKYYNNGQHDAVDYITFMSATCDILCNLENFTNQTYINNNIEYNTNNHKYDNINSNIYSLLFYSFEIIATRCNIKHDYINFYIGSFKCEYMIDIIKNVNIDSIFTYNIVSCMHHIYKTELGNISKNIHESLGVYYTKKHCEFMNLVKKYNIISTDVIPVNSIGGNNNNIINKVKFIGGNNDHIKQLIINLNDDDATSFFDNITKLCNKVVGDNDIKYAQKMLIKNIVDKKLFVLVKNMQQNKKNKINKIDIDKLNDVLKHITESLDSYTKLIQSIPTNNQSLHNGNIVKYLFFIASRILIYDNYNYNYDNKSNMDSNYKKISFTTDNLGEIITGNIYEDIFNFIIEEFKDTQFAFYYDNGYIFHENFCNIDKMIEDVEVNENVFNDIYLSFFENMFFDMDNVGQGTKLYDAIKYINTTYRDWICNLKDYESEAKISANSKVNKEVKTMFDKMTTTISTIGNLAECIGDIHEGIKKIETIKNVLLKKENNYDKKIYEKNDKIIYKKMDKIIFALYSDSNSHLKYIIEISIKCFTLDIYSKVVFSEESIEKNVTGKYKTNIYDIYVNTLNCVEKFNNILINDMGKNKILENYKNIKLSDILSIAGIIEYDINIVIPTDAKKVPVKKSIKNMVKSLEMRAAKLKINDNTTIEQLTNVFTPINGNFKIGESENLVEVADNGKYVTKEMFYLLNELGIILRAIPEFTTYAIYPFNYNYMSDKMIKFKNTLSEMQKTYVTSSELNDIVILANNNLFLYYAYFMGDNGQFYIDKFKDLTSILVNKSKRDDFVIVENGIYKIITKKLDSSFNKPKCSYSYIPSLLEWLNNDNNITRINEYYDYDDICNVLFVKNISIEQYTDDSVLNCKKMNGTTNYYYDINYKILYNILEKIYNNMWYTTSNNLMVTLFFILHVVSLIKLNNEKKEFMTILKKIYDNAKNLLVSEIDDNKKNVNNIVQNDDHYVSYNYSIVTIYMIYNIITEDTLDTLDTFDNIKNNILYCITKYNNKIDNQQSIQITKYRDSYNVVFAGNDYTTKVNDKKKNIIYIKDDKHTNIKIMEILIKYFIDYIIHLDKQMDLLFAEYKDLILNTTDNTTIITNLKQYCPIMSKYNIETDDVQSVDNNGTKNYKINVKKYSITTNGENFDIKIVADRKNFTFNNNPKNNTNDTMNINYDYLYNNFYTWENENIILYEPRYNEKKMFIRNNTDGTFNLFNMSFDDYVDNVNNVNAYMNKHLLGQYNIDSHINDINLSINKFSKRNSFMVFMNSIFSNKYICSYLSIDPNEPSKSIITCEIPVYDLKFEIHADGKVMCNDYTVIFEEECDRKIWIYGMKNMLLLTKKNGNLDEYRVMFLIGDKTIINPDTSNTSFWNIKNDISYITDVFTAETAEFEECAKSTEKYKTYIGCFIYDVHYSNMLITSSSFDKKIIRKGIFLYYLSAYAIGNMEIMSRMNNIIKIAFKDNEQKYMGKLSSIQYREIIADIPFNYFYKKNMLYMNDPNKELTSQDYEQNKHYPIKHGIGLLTCQDKIIEQIIHEKFNIDFVDHTNNNNNSTQILYSFLKCEYIKNSENYHTLLKNGTIDLYLNDVFLLIDIAIRDTKAVEYIINDFDKYVTAYYKKKYSVHRIIQLNKIDKYVIDNKEIQNFCRYIKNCTFIKHTLKYFVNSDNVDDTNILLHYIYTYISIFIKNKKHADLTNLLFGNRIIKKHSANIHKINVVYDNEASYYINNEQYNSILEYIKNICNDILNNKDTTDNNNIKNVIDKFVNENAKNNKIDITYESNIPDEFIKKHIFLEQINNIIEHSEKILTSIDKIISDYTENLFNICNKFSVDNFFEILHIFDNNNFKNYTVKTNIKIYIYDLIYEIIIFALKFGKINKDNFCFILQQSYNSSDIKNNFSEKEIKFYLKLYNIYGNEFTVATNNDNNIDNNINNKNIKISSCTFIRIRHIIKEYSKLSNTEPLLKLVTDLIKKKNLNNNITINNTCTIYEYRDFEYKNQKISIKGIINYVYFKLLNKFPVTSSIFGLIYNMHKKDAHFKLFTATNKKYSFNSLYGIKLTMNNIIKLKEQSLYIDNSLLINKLIKVFINKIVYKNIYTSDVSFSRFSYCVINNEMNDSLEYYKYIESMGKKYKPSNNNINFARISDQFDKNENDTEDSLSFSNKYLEYYNTFVNSHAEIASDNVMNDTNDAIDNKDDVIDNKNNDTSLFNYTNDDTFNEIIYGNNKIKEIFNMIIHKYFTMYGNDNTEKFKFAHGVDLRMFGDDKYNFTNIHLMYQFIFGSFFRKPQYNLINEIIESIDIDSTKTPLFKHLLMGGGKSAVVVPTICMLLQCKQINIEDHGIIVVVPEILLFETYNTLVKNIGWISKKHIRLLHFSRQSNDFINNVNILINSDIKIISDSSIKTCMLGCATEKIASCGHIFKHITNQYIIYDEIDLILDPLKSELNYPVGTTEKINTIENIKYYICYKILKDIHDEKVNSLSTYVTNKQASTTPHFHFIEKVNLLKNNEFIDHVFKIVNIQLKCYLNIEFETIQKFKYILNGEIEIQKGNEYIEIYKFIYKFIVLILPQVLKRVYNVHYGMTKIHNREINTRDICAVPYTAVNTPSKNSEFSDYYYKISYTILSILKDDLRDHDINNILKILNENVGSYKNTIKKICNKVSDTVSGTTKNFTSLLLSRKLKSIYDLKKNELLYNNIKKNKTFKKMYIKNMVCNMTYYKEQYNYSAIDLVAYEHNNKNAKYTGFTGTPFLPDIYRLSKDMIKNKKVKENEEELGAIVASILNSEQIINVKLEKDNDFIDIIIDNLNNYDAFIDVAYFVIEKSTLITTKKISDKIEKNSYVFIDNDGDEKKIYYKNNGVKSYTNINNNNMFVYFDQKHITGFDIPQKHNAKALVSIRKTSTFRDVAQGIFRMRNINKGQTVSFLLLDCPDMNNKKLLKMLLDNEYKTKKDRESLSLMQNVLSIYRNTLINNFCENNSGLDNIIKKVKNIYTNIFSDTYDNNIFSTPNTYIYTSDLCKISDNIYKKIIQNDGKNDKKIDKNDSYIIDNWDDIVKHFCTIERTIGSSLEKEGQIEIQAEVQQEVQQQIVYENLKIIKSIQYSLEFDIIDKKYSDIYNTLYNVTTQSTCFEGFIKISNDKQLVKIYLNESINYKKNVSNKTFNNIGIISYMEKDKNIIVSAMMEYEFIKLKDYHLQLPDNKRNTFLSFWYVCDIQDILHRLNIQNNYLTNVFNILFQLILFNANSYISCKALYKIYKTVIYCEDTKNITLDILMDYVLKHCTYTKNKFNSNIFINRSLMYIIDNCINNNNNNDTKKKKTYDLIKYTYIIIGSFQQLLHNNDDTVFNTQTIDYLTLKCVNNYKQQFKQNDEPFDEIKKLLSYLCKADDNSCDNTIRYFLKTSGIKYKNLKKNK